MREIRLNSKQYKLAPDSDITKRQLNPFRGKLGSTGTLEFDDFGNASLEEYHDFRGGIGLQSEIPTESNRMWWSEGVNHSTPRSAVLEGLVTTAGAFGVAPVKIIDFQSATYAIGASLIAKWNTGTSAWDSKDTSMAAPIDAIVGTDDTDEYIFVSSTTAALYSTDGTTWTTLTSAPGGYMAIYSGRLVFISTDGVTVTFSAFKKFLSFDPAWTTPTGHYDPSAAWDTETNAYDDNTATLADTAAAVAALSWSSYIELTFTEDWYDRCRIWATYLAITITVVDIDVYHDSDWYDLYQGGFTDAAWNTFKLNSTQKISRARIRFYNAHATNPDTPQLYEFDIGKGSYDFTLTGDFGTVYKIFEGKLLADGSPCLYFIGNRGLYTIDIDNEKAYQQEVKYPPLTLAGHAGMYWNSNVWVATGYGILKVAPSTAVHVGPDQDDGLPTGYQGYIYDMVSVANWLFFCVNGGSTDKSSILKRNATLGGNLQVYSTSAANKAITCMLHSPSSLYTNGRLWWGEGTDVKYMMCPDTTSNVKQIATYQYAAISSYCQLPIFRKLAAISKTALGVAAITKSCDANEYATIYYGLNGAAPTTSLGTLKTSPRPTILTFNSGLGTEFYRIQLAYILQRGGTNTNSLELESLLFYYIPTPASIHSWTFNILAVEDDAEEKIAEFEALRDTNTLVVFNPTGDPNKTDFDYNVKLSNMPMRYVVENQQTRQGAIQVTVAEVFNG